MPSGRRDPSHLPARCNAGHRLHHGGPPPAADTHVASIVRDALRFYVGFHEQADGIDGAYLHDPVTLISLLRPDLVTGSVEETLACDTSSDPYLAGSLYRSEADDRPAVSVATAIDADGMKVELIARLGRAVGAPYS